MSRLRSQLDNILHSSDNNITQPQAAYPPAMPNHHAQPQAAFQANNAPQMQNQAPQFTPAAPQAVAGPDIPTIQASLERLSAKLNSISNIERQAPTVAGPDISQLQNTMLSELRADLQNVKSELSAELRSFKETQSQNSPHLDDELKRIADGISLLQDSQSMHPDYIEQMNAEFSNLKLGIEQLASRPDPQFDMSGVARSIESGYSEIAGRLDRYFVDQQNNDQAPNYEMQLTNLSDRVEEVARAVASLSVSPNTDESFERIEARLASLSSSVEQFADQSSAPAPEVGVANFDSTSLLEPIVGQLDMLSQKIDNMLPMADVGEQLEVSNPGNSGIETRLDTLQSDLNILTSHLAQSGGASDVGSSSQIEHALADIAGRIDNIAVGGSGSANTEGQEILTVLRDLSNKIDNAIEQSNEVGEPASTASLEAQLAHISAQLEKPVANSAIDMQPFVERLDNIESQIASSRDIVIDLASQASEKANQEQNTAQSEANARHFEEIANTLSTIAGRLDNLELAPQHQPAPALQGSATMSAATSPVTDTYTAQPESQLPPAMEPQQASVFVDETPSMDLHIDDNNLNTGEKIEPSQLAATSDFDDVPLEPGSGMPDLEALVRKSTQRKKAELEDDGSTSELIARARIAAQASKQEAIESEENNARAAKASQSSFLSGLAEKLPSIDRKKALLGTVAALALGVGAYTVANNFSGPSDQVATIKPAVDKSIDKVSTTIGDAKDTTLAKIDDGVEEAKELTTNSIDTLKDGAEKVAEAPKSILPESEKTAEVSSKQTDDENQLEVNIAGNDLPKEIGNVALQQAAAAGNNDAIFEVARRFQEGQGVTKSFEKAKKWYEVAANADHTPSQYVLGNFYENGHGTKADIKQAIQWYTKAADAGNVLAIHNLGVLHAKGDVSGDADLGSAVEYFTKAANYGVKDSQVNLGILYTKGMGVEQDIVEAYKWFSIAGKAGDQDAISKRDTIARPMRPDQLEKARALVSKWKPKKPELAHNVAQISQDWKSGGEKVKRISKKEIVKQTQKLLSKAGFDAGVADGIFGAKTRDAILSFQKKIGVKQDGQITPDLLKRLSQQAI